MKVISIREPWASLIVNGYKSYEFRNWKTKYRGEVLIHACKTFEKDNIEHFNELNLEYSSGEIIGRAFITDCIEVTSEFENKLIENNKLVYGKSKGRGGYAFKLENVEKFDKKIKASGKLGLWNYEEIR